MIRFHYFSRESLSHRVGPWAQVMWLNGSEWRGLLIIAGRHEIGVRIGGAR